MADNRYIKTKADFTLRKKHKSLTDGTIYETDYMTISPIESLFNEEEYVLQDSNFRFSTRTGINLQKKHKRGNWIPNGVCSGDFETVWTIECMGSGITSDEGKIVLKPNYNSIKQFAYYGGAATLVKASVNSIILYFPAELYITSEPCKATKLTDYGMGSNGLEYVELPGNLKKVKNDYSINIDYTNVNENDVYNPMRYFCLHWADYEIESDGSVEDVTGWSSTSHTEEICDENGRKNYAKIADVKINAYDFEVWRDFNTNKKIIGYKGSKTNVSIRPKRDIIEQYFSGLDDFEKLLLNRESNPKYTAKFITPRQSDTGFTYTFEDYTWPILYGDYTPELEGAAFDIYYRKLITLAEYHDEWDSDNMWRSMTHEAIKNLDWTFFRKNGETTEDMSFIDNTRVEPILKIWGRNFDDIKRFIDNIKACNTVTYDGKNNIPDYFLTDALEIGGWETQVLNLSTDPYCRTDVLYSGMTRGYSSSDVDVEFLRRLKLNSHYILRSKGTRHGIEALLALFGLTTDDYTITEHVAIADGKGPYEPFAPDDGSSTNGNIIYPLARDVITLNKSRNGYFGKHGFEELGGIPVNIVTLSDDNGSVSYVVPWYESEKKYDGGLYFQMNGGWGKRKRKQISLGIAPDVTEISNDRIYDETETYLHFVDTLDGMLELATDDRRKNDVCYVTDISDIISKGYKDENGEVEDISDFSHYFILKDEKIPFIIGYNENTRTFGWKNVPESAILAGQSDDSKVVLYLESIENETEGNNPHIGYGYYDEGNEYLDRMGEIFYHGLRNKEFTSYSSEDCEKIRDYGFEISKEEDNGKCWYFADDRDTLLNEIEATDSGETKFSSTGLPEYDTYDYETVNPEGGDMHGEAAANSVVNIKNIEIEFKMPSKFVEEFKKFITEKVLFYLKQIIPATCIFSYFFEGEEIDDPEPEPEPPKPEKQKQTVTLGIGQRDFPKEGGSTSVTGSALGSVPVTINSQTVDNDWIKITSNGQVTVKPASEGDEQKTYTFSVTGTTEETDTYKTGQSTAQFTITRAAYPRPDQKPKPTLTLSCNDITNVPATATSVSTGITVGGVNPGYNLSCTNPNVTINGTAVTITLTPNDTYESKETEITINGMTVQSVDYDGVTGATCTFTITQLAKDLKNPSVTSVTASPLQFTTGGGESTITVVSDPTAYTMVTLSCNESWVSIKNDKTGFTVAQNTDDYDGRTATVSYKVKTNTTEGYNGQAEGEGTFTVTQDAASIPFRDVTFVLANTVYVQLSDDFNEAAHLDDCKISVNTEQNGSMNVMTFRRQINLDTDKGNTVPFTGGGSETVSVPVTATTIRLKIEENSKNYNYYIRSVNSANGQWLPLDAENVSLKVGYSFDYPITPGSNNLTINLTGGPSSTGLFVLHAGGNGHD